jgi:adenylate cyclase
LANDDSALDRVAPLFGALSPETLRALLQRQRSSTLNPGEPVYQQGEVVDGLSVLLPADVAALPQVADVFWTNQTTGRTLRLERLRAPALCGYVEVVQSGVLLRRQTGSLHRPITARTRLTSVRAVTAIRLIRIPFQALDLLTPDEATDLAAALGRKAAEAFAGGLSVLHDAFIDDGTYRLAAWLRQETAYSLEDGVGGRTARTPPLKQEEIAAQIGLRRDTLNQKLKTLETSGIVSVLPSREIIVHDTERLDQLADLAIRTDFTTFATVRDTIYDALLSGNAFRARNFALDALSNYSNHPEIRHQAVLAMLRCGSFSEASSLLNVFGWDRGLDVVLTSIKDGYASPRGQRRTGEVDEDTEEDANEQARWARDQQVNERRLRIDIPALAARVAKDTAFAALKPGQQGFIPAAGVASARYAEIADRLADPYCAVNAATMARLAGDGARAKVYAQHAVDQSKGVTYWDYATQMEGYLLLDQPEKALVSARKAAALPVTGVSRTGMVASTRLQLRRLEPACGLLTTELRNLLKQKQVVYATGHLPPPSDTDLTAWRAVEIELQAVIDQTYSKLDVGAVFCALAAGSDLLLAERALEAEAAVHVVLPVPVPEFLDRSVRIGNAAANQYWQQRFENIMSLAQTVTVLEEDKPVKARLSFDEAVFAGNRHAAGLALLQADEWEGEAMMVCVHDGSPPGSIAGTSRIRADWQAHGHPAIPLSCSWREGRPLAQEEEIPNSFGAVLFVWLAVPGDDNRHHVKSTPFIDGYLDQAESVLRFHLFPNEQLQRRVLTSQMIGFYIGMRDLARAQILAAALSQTLVPGLDGLRLVLDFGGVFTGSRISEKRLAVLRGARDNVERPLGTVVLTEAFAAEARLRTREPAPFAQIGQQIRTSDSNLVPRSATRYYRGAVPGL